MSSPDIDTSPAVRPARYTRLELKRRASQAPSSEAVIAVATWGRNRTPYCVFVRP